MSSPSPTPDEDWLRPAPGTIGLHQLYPDPNTRSDVTIDIVAVHGLGGDSRSAFTRDNCLWIRDLIPSCQGFENARVMTFGYDSSAFIRPFAKSTKNRTFTFAEALLNDLADSRVSTASRDRPIIFLGYSLGGIVIKNALNYAHARYSQYCHILDSTKAIIFFGTPHQGSATADWASFLGSVGKAVGLRKTKVVDELRSWSTPLVELTINFSELASRFLISTYFETKATNGVLVVPEGSARIGQINERMRGLVADHHDVCKFTETDPNWRAVKGRLEAIMEEIVQGYDLGLPEVPDSLLQSEDSITIESRFQGLRN